MKKYQVIVIDPPWKVKKIKNKQRPNQIEMDYPMMSIDEIKELQIEKILNIILASRSYRLLRNNNDLEN